MINCKNCGANMHFDPATQKLKCDYCDNLEEVASQNASVISSEEDAYDTKMFTCPQCGAVLLSDSDTAATFCSYCGTSVYFEERAVRMKAPTFIIPFQKTREEAGAMYDKLMKNSLFAPSYMKQDPEQSKLRGIYMPYWVYETQLVAPIVSNGQKSHRSGDYILHDNYRFTIQVKEHSNGTSFDASAAFSDELSMAIAPYNFQQSKNFASGYLSGFYVDTADVDASVYEFQAKEVAAADIVSNIMKRYPEYSSYNAVPTLETVGAYVQIQKAEMSYFPVWFLATEHKGYVSYAVINGQTGKIAADIPIDFKKYLLGSFILSLPIMLILNFIFTPRPSILAFGTIVGAIVVYAIANSQLNQLYTRMNFMDDRGLRFARNMPMPEQMSPEVAKKKGGRKPKKAGGADTVWSFILWGSIVAMAFSFEIDSEALTFLSIMVLMVAIVGKAIAGTVSAAAPAKPKKITGKTYVFKQPFKQKVKVLIKPIIVAALAFILLIVNPFIDTVYYVCVFILMAGLLFCFKDVIDTHNKLTRRLPRQFNKRGGDENEMFN